MKKQRTFENAIERINYLSNLPKEERQKELKSIIEPHKFVYNNKRQGFKFPEKRKKKIKAIFHSKLSEVQFRLNIHKQFNGRITIDIPAQYRNEFKDGQLILFKVLPL